MSDIRREREIRLEQLAQCREGHDTRHYYTWLDDIDRLQAALAEKTAELAYVDLVLSRRDALDVFPNRVDKILHAINEAKNVDILRRENTALNKRVKELEDLLTMLGGAKNMSKERRLDIELEGMMEEK